jgi:hypothetical protein
MFIIPNPTPLQINVDYLNHTLESAVISINSAANLMYDFYNTLWTSLPDSQLSAVLQFMYDEGSLYNVLSTNVLMAENINTILSAWNYNGRYLSTLSAGRDFYVDAGVVVLSAAP